MEPFQVYDGETFNQILREKKLTCVKFFTDSEIQFGHKYKEGLNIDSIPFNPSGQCSPGGLYFFIYEYLQKNPEFIKYSPCYITHKRVITIPPEANVYVEEGAKCKADKIILERKEDFTTEEYMLYAEKIYG